MTPVVHFAESDSPSVYCGAVRVYEAIAQGDRVSSDVDRVTCLVCRALLLGEGSISEVEHLRRIGAA